jgi:hypothetical protein
MPGRTDAFVPHRYDFKHFIAVEIMLSNSQTLTNAISFPYYYRNGDIPSDKSVFKNQSLYACGVNTRP